MRQLCNKDGGRRTAATASRARADVDAMRTIQLIQRRGRAVALATNKEAIISERVTGTARRIVAGMALYAVEILAGSRPGPYTDADAERHAQVGLARQRRRRGSPS
jgi:hypothetical protein